MHGADSAVRAPLRLSHTVIVMPRDIEQGSGGEWAVFLCLFSSSLPIEVLIEEIGRPGGTAAHPQQDFDDSANELWSLYGKEAKSHDEEWIKVLKEDMDVIFIFVCASLSCLARVEVTPIP